MRAPRPPQSYDYYGAAKVAYDEGNNKKGDYYWLLYCAKAWDWQPARPRTPRQEEQRQLFSNLGMMTRTAANIQMCIHHIKDPRKRMFLVDAKFILDDEGRLIKRAMKSISERIPYEAAPARDSRPFGLDFLDDKGG